MNEIQMNNKIEVHIISMIAIYLSIDSTHNNKIQTQIDKHAMNMLIIYIVFRAVLSLSSIPRLATCDKLNHV